MTTWAPDLTQLPVANHQQINPAAYTALNVPAMAAGTKYTDPGGSTVVMKLTDKTFPTTSATGFVGPYSGIVTSYSYPWVSALNGKTYYTALVISQSGGAGYYVDIEYDATQVYGSRIRGVSNARPAPATTNVDTCHTFSRNPATPTIAYYVPTTIPATVQRYDVVAMAAANTGNFGVTTFPEHASGSRSLMGTDDDRYFMVMPNAYSDAQVWWDSQTGTKKSFPSSRYSFVDNLSTQLYVKQAYLDRKAGRYAMMGLDGTDVLTTFSVFVWDTTTDQWTVLIRKDNHTDWVDGYAISQDPDNGLNWRYLPAPITGTSPTADPGTMTNIGTLSSLTPWAQHHAGQWKQNGRGVTGAYEVLSEDNPFSPTLSATWTLDSGSVYKTTPSFGFGENTIRQVIQTDSATQTIMQSSLTQAVSRVAMVAGSFFYDSGTTTLYVWATGSLNLATAPARSVLAFPVTNAYFGVVFTNLDASDVRRLCAHYSFGFTFEGQAHAAPSPDGVLVGFDSSMGVWNGAEVQHFVAEVPVTVNGAQTATHLAIQTQPSGSVSGVSLTQQPIVLVEDNTNATVTGDSSTVTATVLTGAGVTITAGSTKAAVAGVASFAGLTLTALVTTTGVVLRFTDGSFTVDSAPFTVTVSGTTPDYGITPGTPAVYRMARGRAVFAGFRRMIRALLGWLTLSSSLA